MPRYPKHVAVAAITDPQEVEQQCITYGFPYEKGAIFCTIPEIGWGGTNYQYCRYGLSLPYIRVQVGWKLLVEPTLIEDSGARKRWFYTGIVDCGGSTGVTPDTDMQMLIQLVAQVIYASGTQLFLSKQDADEPLVLGNTLKTWAQSVDDAISALITWAQTGVAPSGGSSDLGGIAPITPVPTEPEFPDAALSEKVFTE